MTPGRTDSAGSFELPPGGAFPECCFEPLVVTDGTTTHRVDIPHLELTRIDVATDVVTGLVGNAEGAVPELLRLAVRTGSERHETTLEPADIVEAGFGIDFTGILDIREGTVVEASASFPGITLIATSMPFVDRSMAIWPHTGSGETAPWDPDENSIALGGLEPDAELHLTIDGIAVPGAYRVNPTGRFSLELDDVGMTIGLGSELVIQSGTDELRYVVPFLTFEQFDAAAGTASGRVDMEPGTPLWIELWFGPGDGTEATGYFTAAPTVDDGRWSLSFPPLQSGKTVLRATIGLGDNREITQVNFAFE